MMVTSAPTMGVNPSLDRTVPVSANQVNREADRLAYLRAQWGTSCEDGESAHIAGCALLLRTPVIGLRVIDGTDGEAAALVAQLLGGLK